MTKITPKLTVVGAGPGDIDLITVKAINAIASAQVIMYDALVNRLLLKYAAPLAEIIYVGKRKGCYAYQQDQINDLIVVKAKEKGHVVRLKGGDAFVFGRGAEELTYAQKSGLEIDLVPGVSSALAVPVNAGFPLTMRGVSESFWVITATTQNHELSNDVCFAAKSNATVILLMGMHKLNEIISVFKAENKHHTAVAIIQNGTTSNEQVGIGTIQTIAGIVAAQNLSSPAIIIIGEVVNKRIALDSIIKKVAAY